MGSFQSLGPLFTSPPAIVTFGPDDISVFIFAVGRDQALWYSRLDGLTGDDGVFSNWQSLGGIVTSSPCALRSGESSVDVFATGPRSELLHWQFRNKAWTRWPFDISVGEALELAPRIPIDGLFRNWESLGGIVVSQPHATVFGELQDMILVFGVGTDHALWSRGLTNGVWSEWQSLGHRLASPPFSTTFQRETFAVFALGIDSGIWYTTGSDWHSLGAPFASAPCAVSTSRHIHVFAADAERALQHRSWDGQSWTDWESLGGILTSAPTANQQGELIHVFGVGTDSAIWRRRWLGDTWTDWHSLGGSFLAPPGAIGRDLDGFAVRDLAALGTDHAVFHMEEDDP
jgi:hypothetical protein